MSATDDYEEAIALMVDGFLLDIENAVANSSVDYVRSLKPLWQKQFRTHCRLLAEKDFVRPVADEAKVLEDSRNRILASVTFRRIFGDNP